MILGYFRFFHRVFKKFNFLFSFCDDVNQESFDTPFVTILRRRKTNFQSQYFGNGCIYSSGELYNFLLKWYVSGRKFKINYEYEDAYLNLKCIRPSVPQRNVLGPMLYLLETADIPTIINSTVATCVQMILLATGYSAIEAKPKLQKSLNKVISWTCKWCIN